MIHILKTEQPHFDSVWHGDKTFEVRPNDRNYQEGDILILSEGTTERQAPKAVIARVSHMLTSADGFGCIVEGNVVLGLRVLGRIDDDVTMFEYERRHVTSNEWTLHYLGSKASVVKLAP